MITCPFCGNQSPDGTTQCAQCGAQLGAVLPDGVAAPAQQPAARQVPPSAAPLPQQVQPGMPPYASAPIYAQQSSYKTLGGWLLALVIWFGVSALYGLYSAVGRISSVPLSAVGTLIVALAAGVLTVMIVLKNKKYLIAFYAYVVLQIVVLLTQIPTVISQAHTLSSVDTILGADTVNTIAATTVIATLAIYIGMAIGMWFYFRKSKRVAEYFGQN